MSGRLGARTWSTSSTDYALPSPKGIDERDLAIFGLSLIAVLLVALLVSDRMGGSSDGDDQSTTEAKNTRHADASGGLVGP